MCKVKFQLTYDLVGMRISNKVSKMIVELPYQPVKGMEFHPQDLSEILQLTPAEKRRLVKEGSTGRVDVIFMHSGYLEVFCCDSYEPGRKD